MFLSLLSFDMLLSYISKVGGGLAARMTVQGTLIKECIEEAAIPEELARHARPAGTVRYIHNCRKICLVSDIFLVIKESN